MGFAKTTNNHTLEGGNMHRHSISWPHGCRYRTTLAVVKIVCICLFASCKPIVREAPTSDAQLAILLKGMAGMIFAPLLGAKKAVKVAIDSLATTNRSTELLTLINDVKWHTVGVKSRYEKTHSEAVKRS